MIKLNELKKRFKNLPKKKLFIILGAVVVLAGLAYWSMTFFKSAPKTNYEVAIMVRDQNNSDPIEDKKNSLKAGDVFVIQAEGHNWSKTEEISYLIIKMSLTDDQKEKLTSPVEREIKIEELSQEEQQRIKDEKQRAKDAGEEYREEPRMETLMMRAYNIDMSIFKEKGFKPLDLIKKQPFQEEIYDWGIVKKKD